MSGRAEAAAKALTNEGAGPGNSIHSWRCEYPDRYGPCDCVTQAAEIVVAALDRWDRDHGVVRVDTRGEATVERITHLLVDEFAGTEKASALVARAIRHVLATLDSQKPEETTG